MKRLFDRYDIKKINIRERLLTAIFGTLIVLNLVGCSGENGSALLPIAKESYQKVDYKTVEVERGDVEPTLKLKLKPQTVDQINYSVELADIEIDEVNVSVGDHVKKGQVMVSFKSETIRKNITKYESELKKTKLLLEHYQKLMEVDTQDKVYTGMRQKDIDRIYAEKNESEVNKKANYEVEIQKLSEDVAMAQMYLSEEKQRLAECQVVAENDGVVIYVSKNLMSGYVEPGVRILSEVCGESCYAASTEDDYDFKMGDIFEAEEGENTYEMRVIEIKPNDEGGRYIFFEMVNDTVDPSNAKILDMSVKKETLKDVVTVSKKAVTQKEDGTAFVFVVDENGFLEPRYVKVGETVDDKLVIKEGLRGTEKVAVR